MKEILPVIMSNTFEKLAVIDDYISLIWTSRYYSVGDFELCLNADSHNVGLIQKDYFVVREDDENIGIIENVRIQRNEDGNEILIASGRFLAGILERRIIAVQTTVTGKISACVTKLIEDNVTQPLIADRQIDNFIIGDFDIDTTMNAQYTGQNLLETISDICETYGVGFKVTLNENNQFVFTLYEGVDRTYDQSTNPWVIFSDRFDNLLSSEYEENYKTLATAALVAGEGEGLSRKTAWVSDGSTGINRREVYVDQRNIRSNDGNISTSDYNKLLEEAGKEALTKYTTAFTGTVYFDGLTYRQDISLGDLCVIENAKWGIYLNTRLVEVVESVSETGQYTIEPTFGV